MEFLQTTDFWIGLLKIVWINIILSGDNAVVIAMAARSLPPHQQRTAVLFGSGAAVVLRIALTVVAAKLLALPYLQIVGGVLLLWIGTQLLSEEDEGEGEDQHHHPPRLDPRVEVADGVATAVAGDASREDEADERREAEQAEHAGV